MGLLDDAIREHLELKRRRGADAEEVSRLEQEALGPPQRGEFAAAGGPAAPVEPAEALDPAAPLDPAEPADPPPPADAEDAWLDDDPEPAPEPPEDPAEEPTAAYQAPAEAPGEGEDVLEE